LRQIYIEIRSVPRISYALGKKQYREEGSCPKKSLYRNSYIIYLKIAKIKLITVDLVVDALKISLIKCSI